MPKATTVSKEMYLREAGFDSLPSSWDVVQVEELLSDDRGISVGVMYPGKHDPDGIPLIKAGDLVGDTISPSPEFRVSPEKHEEYRRTEFQGGEILMTLVGNVGQCAVVPPEMKGWNAARAVAVIRLENADDAEFVRHCLLSDQLNHLMNAWANTTVQPTLNLKEIRKLPLPWPPKPERDAIASILGALDDKIELNRRMNATLESLARAIFKSWFVDFDPVKINAGQMPADGHDPKVLDLFPSTFQDSEIGPIPEGWEAKSLTDIADVLSGGTPKKKVKEYWNGDLPWISPKAMDGIHVFESESCVTAAAVGNGTRLVPAGTTLVMVRGMGLHQGVRISQAQRDVTFNQDVKALVPTTVDSTFLLYAMLHLAPKLFGKVRAAGHGTGVLSTDIIASLQFAVSKGNSLAEFTQPLAELNQQIHANELESQGLAKLRDALLPRLLSGELTVPEALTETQEAQA
jgi:type I restriction enzyme S subunit